MNVTGILCQKIKKCGLYCNMTFASQHDVIFDFGRHFTVLHIPRLKSLWSAPDKTGFRSVIVVLTVRSISPFSMERFRST